MTDRDLQDLQVGDLVTHINIPGGVYQVVNFDHRNRTVIVRHHEGKKHRTLDVDLGLWQASTLFIEPYDDFRDLVVGPDRGL